MPAHQYNSKAAIVNTGVVHCKENKKPSLNEPQRKKRSAIQEQGGANTEIERVMGEPPPPSSAAQETKIVFCLTNKPALT